MPLLFHFVYLTSGFLTLSMVVGLFFKQPNKDIIRVFTGAGVAAAAWVISLYLFYVSSDPITVLIIGRANFVFTSLIVTFFFFFAYLFPKKSYAMPRILLWLVIAETVALSVVTFTTSLVDENEIVNGVSRVTVYGPLYWWFVVHFLTLSVATIGIFIHKYSRFTGVLRKQLVNLALGWGSGLVIGSVTNIFIPMLTGWYDSQHLGPFAAIIFVGATTYAIAKHELFSLKLISTEFLVVFVVLIMLINSMIMPGATLRIISAVSTFLVLVMGVALIYNVREEVSEREQLDNANRELAVANAQLKEMDQIKNEFITMASHQLRTPISVVKGYLSLMLEEAYGQVPEAIKDKLQQIYGLNERLVQMIDNMLNAARIEKRRVEYSIVRADLLSSVRKVIEEMRVKSDEKGLKLDFKGPNNPVMAYFDEDKMHEVLTNLIDNAIKYTDGGDVSVVVRDDGTDGFVSVDIRDSGIGMTKEEASRVFTKFFRAKEAVIREPGTGLGLFICAKFMNGMGGEIGVVETEAGKGTTFGIRLPVSKPEEAES